jgi:hypothetical protein
MRVGSGVEYLLTTANLSSPALLIGSTKIFFEEESRFEPVWQ